MARPKDLHTLIRMRKWDVDEKQRAVGVLLRREEAILAAQNDLASEIEQEKTFVGQAEVIETTFTFSAYLGRCHVRREQLAQALMEVRRLIDEAREELAGAYRQLKTVEVTQEQRDTAEEKEDARRENLELDEIGLNLYRRAAS